MLFSLNIKIFFVILQTDWIQQNSQFKEQFFKIIVKSTYFSFLKVSYKISEPFFIALFYVLHQERGSWLHLLPLPFPS